MNTTKHTGFTIIESLVAITIIVSVVTGALGAVSTSIKSDIYSKDQILAFNLAQEAVEMVVKMRSENALQGDPWLQGIDCDDIPCKVDVLLDSITACDGPCPVLTQDESTRWLNLDEDDTPTIFTRQLVVDEISSDREATVEATVSWTSHGTARQFVIRENIFNWHDDE